MMSKEPPPRTPLLPFAVLLAVGCELADPRAADVAGELNGGEVGALADGDDPADPADPRDDPDCELTERDGDLEKWLCTRVEGGGEMAEGVICWYITWVIRIDGEIVFTWTEFLGCEGGGGGGGGSCGEGGIGGEDTLAYCQRGEIWLECDKVKPERGQRVTCEIKTDTLDLSLFNYAWTVNPGSWTSSDSKWDGIATTDREVSVMVTDDKTGNELLDKDTTIEVQARTWEFESMTHPTPTYSVPPNPHPLAWGGYETLIADRSEPMAGSGPWDDEHFMHRPVQFKGKMHIHPDFVDGRRYPHAKTQACSAAPDSAGVRTVNQVCGGQQFIDSLNLWEGSVRSHEQEHEDGANLCLVGDRVRGPGAAAQKVLADTEAIVGSEDWRVKSRFDSLVMLFARGPLARARETRTSTPRSPVIWDWRLLGRWNDHSLQPYPHGGTTGC